MKQRLLCIHVGSMGVNEKKELSHKAYKSGGKQQGEPDKVEEEDLEYHSGYGDRRIFK